MSVVSVPVHLATHQIVGMGEAFRVAKEDMQKDYDHALALRNRLIRWH